MAGATGSRAFSTPGVALDAPGASWAPSMYLLMPWPRGKWCLAATIIFPQKNNLLISNIWRVVWIGGGVTLSRRWFVTFFVIYPYLGRWSNIFLNGLKSPTSCEPPLFSCFLRLGLEGPGHGNMFTPGKTTWPVTETEGCLEVDVGYYYIVRGGNITNLYP